MRRRDFLPALALSTAAAQTPAPAGNSGRLKQCVTRGVFGRGMSFEDTCREAARAGAKGYDLIGPNDWPTLKKYGLIPTMYPPGPGGTISDGINRKESHAALEKRMHSAIEESAANGVPSIIALSGTRKGMPDSEGADNCVAFFNLVKAHAEDRGINICIEYLNSKVDHKDYMFDHIAWGVDVPALLAESVARRVHGRRARRQPPCQPGPSCAVDAAILRRL